MTTARTFETLYQTKAAKRVATLFNELMIYRVCLVVAALDFFDIFDFLEASNLAKYSYAVVMLGLIAIYFIRWKRVEATIAPTIFLLFFFVTGFAFAIRLFVFDERNSYISAFISPLIFSAAMFIPKSIMLDARKILRDLTILFSAGALFYLVEAIVRPYALASPLGFNDIAIVKSMNCVIAICLAILIDRKILALILTITTLIAFGLRPTSTLLLGLVCCIPIAILLRRRVLGCRPISVLLGRAVAIGVLIMAVSIPLLLYFFFDEVAPVIANLESSLKKDVIGGISSVDFRLAILRLAFAAIDKTSFWYGSALSGNISVPLGQAQSWAWWFTQDPNGQAAIHSDFVIVLCLMGIIGYTAFSAAFYFILRPRFRELLRRDIGGTRVALQAISIVACVALVIYCSDEPYLAFYSHINAVWMVLLISEMARKSKLVG